MAHITPILPQWGRALVLRGLGCKRGSRLPPQRKTVHLPQLKANIPLVANVASPPIGAFISLMGRMGSMLEKAVLVYLCTIEFSSSEQLCAKQSCVLKFGQSGPKTWCHIFFIEQGRSVWGLLCYC